VANNSQSTRLQSIFDRLQIGDQAAKDELLAHMNDRLRRLTATLLRDFPAVRRWDQTDDVWQEVAIKLHRALDDLKPGNVQELLGLAAKRIRWTLLDLVRKHQGPQGLGAKHQSAGGRDSKGDVRQHDPPDDTAGPRTLAELAELHALVDSLPNEEREAFELRYYNGLSRGEVAELLGVSERTVQRRMRAAKELLYAKLHRED